MAGSGIVGAASSTATNGCKLLVRNNGLPPETSTVEPGAAEVKYYAKGVGEVSERYLVTQEQLDLESVDHKLVQAMASFDASNPGTSTPSPTQTTNDSGMQQIVAAHGQA